jgi:hypothetical protein
MSQHREALEKLQLVHCGGDRNGFITQFLQYCVFEIRVAMSLAKSLAFACHCNGTHHHQVDVRKLIERERFTELPTHLHAGSIPMVSCGNPLGIQQIKSSA